MVREQSAYACMEIEETDDLVRDEFARAALMGILSSGWKCPDGHEYPLAKKVFDIADAMLAYRDGDLPE